MSSTKKATTRFALFVGALAGGAVIAGASEVAEARRGRIDRALYRRPLVLTSFVQNTRTDVRRNEVLQFKFSAIVARRSVDSRALRVLELTTAGRRQATGALIVKANVVRFDPTRSQRNYDDSRRPNSAITDGDNPVGFNSYTDFIVEIPGPPELHTLRNARGEGIRLKYDGQFATAGSYYDPVPGQPYFVGYLSSGNLGFEPPRSGATGLVDEDAVILLEFNEPIDIDTLDPSATVSVVRTRVNEGVPGFIRLDPNDRSGRRFQFVPSLGFGSDLANFAGWDIQVTLSDQIKDLAGNPLKRPYVAPIFRTRYVAGKKSASVISETFDNQLKMDTVTLTDGGEWNTIEKGALRGGVVTTYPAVDVSYWYQPPPGLSPAFTRQNHPLVTDQGGPGCLTVPFGSRTQLMYIPDDVGEAAAIVSMGWGASSNALFGATHPEITLKLGHTSASALGSDLEGNVNIGSLVQVYRGPYTIPQQKNIQPSDGETVAGSGVTRDPVPAPNGNARGCWSFPIFTSPFEWNGVNNLVVDVACQPANNCQIIRGAFFAAGVPFPARRAISQNYTGTAADFPGTPDQLVYDWRFHKRRRTTRATSLWYELASDTPQFGNPIVSPVSQPGGVTAVVELEAAHGKADPLNPGKFVPNTATATGWTTDVSKIDGHRFFRFRVTMVANLNSNQSARVSAVQFPYLF